MGRYTETHRILARAVGALFLAIAVLALVETRLAGPPGSGAIFTAGTLLTTVALLLGVALFTVGQWATDPQARALNVLVGACLVLGGVVGLVAGDWAFSTFAYNTGDALLDLALGCLLLAAGWFVEGVPPYPTA